MLAALARLLLQIAAMPPYAGLDEIYHVARIVFVMNEGRNPDADEPSVPRFVHDSLAAKPGSLPDFPHARERWPELVRGAYRLPPQQPLSDERAYVSINYEAQQPSLYYWTAAIAARALPDRTPLTQLRLWRLQSVFLALITIAATALLGYRLFGASGMVAALLLPHLPTWQTLVTRASNDALPCALLALALLATAGGGARPRFTEAVMWALALTAKLYTWPAAAILPLLWWKQRASRARMALVSIFCAIAVLVTMFDVRGRTGKALGLEAFNAPRESARAEVPIDYAAIVKVTIASGIWMSGQHDNALTVRGMALYVLPIVLLIGWTLFRGRAQLHEQRPWLLATAIAIIAFLLAQGVHLSGYVRQAKALGSSMPLAGKEGWYWFVLAPLVLSAFFGWVFRVSPRVVTVFVIVWVLLADIAISEGALFRDYAGLTSPASPSQWFRWGPAPMFGGGLRDALLRVAIGPLTGAIVWLRAIDVAAIAAIVVSRQK